jgi:hypothetical protein
MYIIVRVHKNFGKWEIVPGYPPTIIHPSYAHACEEAHRLAGAHPGVHFAVFEFDKAAVCAVTPVDWIKL